MMIEFSVANFRSFRDEQRFSLVASTADKSLAENVGVSAGFKQRLLRSAVVYGPNASGKSNLILALGFLHLLILRAAQSPPDGWASSDRSPAAQTICPGGRK